MSRTSAARTTTTSDGSISNCHNDGAVTKEVTLDATVAPVRILAFTWNAQSVRLAEQSGAGHQAATWVPISYKRYDPDFVPTLIETVRRGNYDLVACALQEAPKPGSHLLSDALPEALGAIGYECLHRVRFIGVGKTTYQNLRDNGDLVPRGLRLGVFVRRAWLQGRTVTVDDGWWPCTGLDRWTRGKGGVGISVHVPRVGRIGFLNCHLPFDADSVEKNNATRMTSGVMHQARCMSELLERFHAEHRPHYLVVMGDMNFRLLNRSNEVDPRAVWAVLARSEGDRLMLYKMRDELRLSIDFGVLPPFREGVDNKGPTTFMPTGKMGHGRQSGDTQLRAYFFGHKNTLNPSWCDRVLYARADEVLRNALRPHAVRGERYVEGRGDVRCLMYDRFEAGQTMTRSDHSAVVAALAVEPHEFPAERVDGEAAAAVAEPIGQTAFNGAPPGTALTDEPVLMFLSTTPERCRMTGGDGDDFSPCLSQRKTTTTTTTTTTRVVCDNHAKSGSDANHTSTAAAVGGGHRSGARNANADSSGANDATGASRSTNSACEIESTAGLGPTREQRVASGRSCVEGDARDASAVVSEHSDAGAEGSGSADNKSQRPTTAPSRADHSARSDTFSSSRSSNDDGREECGSDSDGNF